MEDHSKKIFFKPYRLIINYIKELSTKKQLYLKEDKAAFTHLTSKSTK